MLLDLIFTLAYCVSVPNGESVFTAISICCRNHQLLSDILGVTDRMWQNLTKQHLSEKDFFCDRLISAIVSVNSQRRKFKFLHFSGNYLWEKPGLT